MMAKRRAGARWTTAAPALKSQASPTARRNLLALQAGRVPGKPGPNTTVEGSIGGKNGAREADRRAASRAAKLGVRPKPAKRVAYKAKPAAATHAWNSLASLAHRTAAMQHSISCNIAHIQIVEDYHPTIMCIGNMQLALNTLHCCIRQNALSNKLRMVMGGLQSN